MQSPACQWTIVPPALQRRSHMRPRQVTGSVMNLSPHRMVAESNAEGERSSTSPSIGWNSEFPSLRACAFPATTSVAVIYPPGPTRRAAGIASTPVPHTEDMMSIVNSGKFLQSFRDCAKCHGQWSIILAPARHERTPGLGLPRLAIFAALSVALIPIRNSLLNHVRFITHVPYINRIHTPFA